MKVIFKYPLDGSLRVSLPAGAKILTVGNQREELMLWAEVDTTASSEMRQFRVYGTGDQMPDDPGTWVGTALFMQGAVVWHVYVQ